MKIREIAGQTHDQLVIVPPILVITFAAHGRLIRIDVFPAVIGRPILAIWGAHRPRSSNR